MNSPIKKKKEDSIFGTFSPVKKSQTTIENKKSEILNILNNRDSVKNSNTSSNGGKVSSNQRIAAVLKNKESDDFIKKIGKAF